MNEKFFVVNESTSIVIKEFETLSEAQEFALNEAKKNGYKSPLLIKDSTGKSVAKIQLLLD